MTDLSDFFSHAWQTIGRAIAMAGIRAGLSEVPETISKTVKRRCQAELKRLGILLRRLIFLMALHAQLAPVLAAPLIDRWKAMLEALQGAARNALRAHCSASKRKARLRLTSFPFQRPTPCTAPWPSSGAGSPCS
jgi:hypothetical protein